MFYWMFLKHIVYFTLQLIPFLSTTVLVSYGPLCSAAALHDLFGKLILFQGVSFSFLSSLEENAVGN